MNTNFAKPLLLFGILATLISLTSGQYCHAGNYAILVGVENYGNVPSLKHIDNDVDAVANVLTTRGTSFPAENVAKICERALGQPMTRSFLMQQVQVLLPKLTENDTLLFYFSGHGTQLGDKELFLCGSDISPEDPASTGISFAWLKEQLDGCKAKSKIIIFDCCHAGSQKSLPPIKMAYMQAPVWGNSNLLRLASCNENQSSLVWDDRKQSLFTFWMVQALKGFADRNLDGRISFQELHDYVYQYVPLSANTVSNSNQQQTPVREIPLSIQGDPVVMEYRPTDIKTYIADLGDLLLQRCRDEKYDKIAVLDFQDDTQLVLRLGGDFALLGRKCARWLYDEIPTREAYPQKLGWRELQSLLSTEEFQVNSLGDQASLQKLSDKVGQTVAVATGTFRQLLGNDLQLTIELLTIDPDTGSLKTSANYGRVVLSDSERSLLSIPEHPNIAHDVVAPLNPKHPLTDPNFPLPVEIYVRQGEAWVKRNGRFENNQKDYVVSLSPGEEYRVYVGNSLGTPVAMRLLVDGLDTIHHPGEANPFPADFDTARYWILDPKNHPISSRLNGQIRWAIKGFMLSAPKDDAKEQFSQFTVGDATSAWANRQRFTENIGLVSAAFYRTELQNGTRNIGTVPGRTIEENVNVRKDLVPAEKIAVIHIRYVRK